jgi:hypothetical protein
VRSSCTAITVCRASSCAAHILGLGDTAEGPAILNQQAAGGDPICSRTFFLHRLGHAAKRWLRSHGYSGSG